MWMATVQRSSAALGGLARKLAQTIDDTTLARRAARLVQDHAADGQLALATLSRLAEESPASMRSALGDRDQADLIFCLGASEVVAAEISQAGSNWLDIFDAARTATAAS